MIFACTKCGIAIPVILKAGASSSQSPSDVWNRQIACHRCRSVFAIEVRCLREGEKLAEVLEKEREAKITPVPVPDKEAKI